MIIPDKSHIGSLDTNRGRPTFTAEQIVQIYEAAGRARSWMTCWQRPECFFQTYWKTACRPSGVPKEWGGPF